MKVIPALLIILDGFGCRANGADNAIFQAKKPHWNKLWSDYPHTLIHASEAEVGLPKGQMGNSEVGHLNIGAGVWCTKSSPGLTAPLKPATSSPTRR